MNIAATIKQLRKDAELTQGDLSSIVGMTQTAISQIEAGVRVPHPSTLQAIAEALNVSVALIYIMAISPADMPKSDKPREAYASMLECGKVLMLKALKS